MKRPPAEKEREREHIYIYSAPRVPRSFVRNLGPVRPSMQLAATPLNGCIVKVL